jgi:hypothetical protein
VTTRGIYTNDTVNGYVASLTSSPWRNPGFPTPVTWGETAEAWWQVYCCPALVFRRVLLDRI